MKDSSEPPVSLTGEGGAAPTQLRQKQGRTKKMPAVQLLSPQEANNMLDAWHYLGGVRGIILAVGHEEGCCVFTNLRGRNLERWFHHPIELVRMVGAPEHCWAMTSLMAASLRYVKQLGYRTCISYADPRNGNLGVVYRAGGWRQIGTTSPDTVYLLDAKRTAKRTFYDRPGTQSRAVFQAIYGDRLAFEATLPKFRFIKVL